MNERKIGKINNRNNKISESTKKDENFKYSACSPISNHKTKNHTCMDGEHLRELAELWNKRHPELRIETTSPREIWMFFKSVFSKTCESERCWIKNRMFGAGIDGDLLNELNELYAPDAPQEWRENPRTWLNSMDILSVMRQYEKKYKCFNFIGPTPIDFDKIINDKGKKACVWDELCNFNILNQGTKNKIGIIFNTDPHDKSGEHWVSLFIDMKRRNIVYFDSAGSYIPPEIKTFVERIQKQLKNNNEKEYKFIINKKEHQKKNTECGMYSLYFIIQMLKNGDYKYFTESKQTITDEQMEDLRNEYFNI